MKRAEMEKQQAVEAILTYQWWFAFFICVSGGVVANESLSKIKDSTRLISWNLVFAKWVVACFICTLIHAFYDWKQYNPKFEYAFLLLASFLHLPIAVWIRTNLWPIILGSLKEGKKND